MIAMTNLSCLEYIFREYSSSSLSTVSPNYVLFERVRLCTDMILIVHLMVQLLLG